jgi:acetyl-CoA acetyltransferase
VRLAERRAGRQHRPDRDLAGWGDVPGVTINRFCASGIDAVAQAAARIRGDGLELVAAGAFAALCLRFRA